jgi:hypothetical protein
MTPWEAQDDRGNDDRCERPLAMPCGVVKGKRCLRTWAEVGGCWRLLSRAVQTLGVFLNNFKN